MSARYVDPMLPRMSAPQLRQVIRQAAQLLSDLDGRVAARRELYSALRQLSPGTDEAMAQIAERIASEHGVTLDDLKSPSLARHLSEPRLKAYVEIYETGRFSYPQIARFFRRSSHGAVLLGIRNLKRRQAATARSA